MKMAENVGLVIAGAAVLYWVGSLFVFSAMHPKLTQMEVLLRAGEALTWLW